MATAHTTDTDNGTHSSTSPTASSAHSPTRECTNAEWKSKVANTRHGKQLTRLWSDCDALCQNPSVYRTCPRVDAYDRHEVFMHLLNTNPSALGMPIKIPPFVALVNIAGELHLWTSKHRWLFIRLAQCVARGYWNAVAPLKRVTDFLESYLCSHLATAKAAHDAFLVMTYSLPAFVDVHEVYWQIRSVRRERAATPFVDDGPMLTSDRPIEAYNLAHHTNALTSNSATGLRDAVVRAFVASTTITDWDAPVCHDPEQADAALRKTANALQLELKKREAQHKEEVESLRAERRKLVEEKAAVTAQLDALRVDLKRANADYLETDTRCTKLLARVASLEESKRVLQQQKQKADLDHARESKKIETLHAGTVDEQDRKYLTLQLDERAAKARVAELEVEVAALQRERDDAVATIDAMNTRFDANAADNNRMRILNVCVKLQHTALIARRRDAFDTAAQLAEARKKCASVASKVQRRAAKPSTLVCSTEVQTDPVPHCAPSPALEAAVQTDMDVRLLEIDELKQEVFTVNEEKARVSAELASLKATTKLREAQPAHSNDGQPKAEFDDMMHQNGALVQPSSPQLEHAIAQLVVNMKYVVDTARMGGVHEHAASEMAMQLRFSHPHVQSPQQMGQMQYMHTGYFAPGPHAPPPGGYFVQNGSFS